VSPKIVLVKVLFCSSPTTVDLQSARAWDWADGSAARVVRQNTSAKRQTTPHDLVGMRNYLKYRDSNRDALWESKNREKPFLRRKLQLTR
jgi:hypothetical protein